MQVKEGHSRAVTLVASDACGKALFKAILTPGGEYYIHPTGRSSIFQLSKLYRQAGAAGAPLVADNKRQRPPDETNVLAPVRTKFRRLNNKGGYVTTPFHSPL
jgi:hypothetical protein